jgi:hypothetical protein
MEKRQTFYQMLNSVINNEILKTERGIDMNNKFLGKVNILINPKNILLGSFQL